MDHYIYGPATDVIEYGLPYCIYETCFRNATNGKVCDKHYTKCCKVKGCYRVISQNNLCKKHNCIIFNE